jgi:type II secretory pathway pseudopilin PulG
MSDPVREPVVSLRDESGIALVVALMISLLLLAAGLGLLAFTDGQAKATGTERVRESVITLSEGALNAQANLLSAAWPDTPDKAFAPCTDASTSVTCPNPGNLIRGFTSREFTNGGSVTWHISVRDNALGSYYDDSATASQPAWDASGPSGGGPDGIMWLRAQASIRGSSRTLVSLVQATPITQAFPRGVVTAGHFHTTNNGNKILVDTSGGPGLLARCSPGAGGPARGNSCLDYDVTKGQVWPNSWTADPSLPDAMTASDISSLRNRARAAGTWYSGCPASLPSAPLVFIESGDCSYSSSTQYNSASSPGLLVIYNGTLTFAGGTIFYGLIYAPNAGGLTGNVITLAGESQSYGAVVVDGAGGVSVGGSKLSLVYDPNVFNLVTTTQTINVIANSWRELNGH